MVKLVWTKAMERALLQSMVDAVRSGKRAESGFKKEAWTQAINDVKTAAHSSDIITPEKIKNKLQSLKQLWKEWIRLDEKVSGWGWDDSIQLFLAEPEQWEAHLAIYPNAKPLRHKPLYNRDLLLELFDGILANGASAIGIKAAVAEIQNEETISEEEKEDKPTQDVSDPQENSDCDNSPTNWPDSLPASPRTATNDGSFINTPNKDGLDSQPEQDLSSTPDVPSSTSATAYHKKKSTQSAPSNNKQSKKKEKLKRDASTQEAPTSSQKRTRVSGGSLLANSLDAVVNELREGRLQRAEEIQAENIRREKDRLDKFEESLPAIHQGTKKLITVYGHREELIPWALKVFLEETNAQMFLCLDGKWQLEWLERVCEERKIRDQVIDN